MVSKVLVRKFQCVSSNAYAVISVEERSIYILKRKARILSEFKVIRRGLVFDFLRAALSSVGN